MEREKTETINVKTRRLHIGGKEVKDGWEIFNILSDEGVDHVGDATDLSRFEDETFKEIYASHILEHLDYNGQLQNALKEWHRVLKPGGNLYVGVPNLDTLCKIFIHQDLTPDEKFFVMRMIYGGHIDKHDYHYTGFNTIILSSLLSQAGFNSIKMVDQFGLFNDTSNLKFREVPISLNLIAVKPEIKP